MKISLIIFSLFICFAACAVHHIPLHRSKSHESTPKNLPKLYTQDLDGYAMIPNVTTLIGTVSIGSPAQNFTVFLDTNSSDLWVGGQNCSGFLGTNTYNSSASPMFVGLLDDFNLTYSLGYVTGSMGMDVVSFAGLDVGYMDIGIASDISLFAIPVDGVLGLGFPQLNSYDGMGLMEQIMSNKDLNETGFSLYLSSNYSALILGGVDSKYAKSKFTYYPIAGDGYWSFFGNLSMEGVSLAEELELAIQTASSNILFPEVIFGTFLIYTGLKYENVYQPDIVHFLRSIEVQVGSETLIIPPEAYMLCTEAQCSLAVQIQLPGVNKITLGDQFLQTYYTHFDYQNMRIGFAEPAL